MRTLLGLIVAVSAYLLLSYTLGWVSDPAGMSERTGVYPFAPPTWQAFAGALVASALMGGLAFQLMRRGVLGRLVRGRSFTPEPVRP